MILCLPTSCGKNAGSDKTLRKSTLSEIELFLLSFFHVPSSFNS